MRRLVRDLYYGRTDFRIVERRRAFYAVSALLVTGSIVAVVLLGLNLSIDFRGGTSWKVSYGASQTPDAASSSEEGGARRAAREAGAPDESAIRDAVARGGASAEKVLYLGSSQIEVQSAPVESAVAESVSRELASLVGADADRFQEVVSVSSVSATWGAQISRKAVQALVVFLVAVSVYISARFQWRMAVAALVALAHDILITIGTYAVTRFTVAPATVIATLTILGYSLYDDVVVFDRVKETAGTAEAGKQDFSELVNRSLNQVLMRSLNTSLTSLLPVCALLVAGVVLGVPTLKDFALALFVGIMAGTYSSIFVASPLLVTLGRDQVRAVGLADARRRALESARKRGAGSRALPSGADRGLEVGAGAGSREERFELPPEADAAEPTAASRTASGSASRPRGSSKPRAKKSARSVPSKSKGKSKKRRK